MCMFVCVSVIRQEIQRLLDEREELSRSLKVFQKSFNPKTEACVVRDLTATLASGDAVHRELEADKGKLASLKYQVTSVFLLNGHLIPVFSVKLTLLADRSLNGRGSWQN